jgi:hypothetical protein
MSKRKIRFSYATMPITVTPTQRNIDEAVRADCNACVFAKAITDLPFVAVAEVNKTRTRVTRIDGSVVEWMTPCAAKNALNKFDEGHGWEPVVGRAFIFPPVPKRLTREALKLRAKRIRKARAKAGLPTTKKYENTGRNTASVRQITAYKKRQKLDEVLNAL